MTNRFQESLDYLYSLQFFGIKLGLDNIRSLLDRVGNPQQQLRIIHVAGTNGKGSTSAAITSILHAAGFATGLYTSPHLHHFTERIRVNTSQISEAEVVALTEELRPHAEDLRATFFEFTTAMALLCFARHQVDWVVLETGMGGRLDATNAVLPELCVITPIAMDHAGYLGDSLAAIAQEKAGIIKAGVPVVCAEQDEAAARVLRSVAAELACPFVMAGNDFRIDSANCKERFSVTMADIVYGPFSSALAGCHQHQNLGLAIAAVMTLQRHGLSIGGTALTQGVARVRWPGRLEWLGGNILLDGAHNCAGIEALAAYLTAQKLSAVHLVFGCKADKQASTMLKRLLPFVGHIYLTTPPDVDAVEPEVLLAVARENGVQAESYATPVAALVAAQQLRSADRTIVVAGSLFLIAALRAQLVDDPNVLEIIG